MYFVRLCGWLALLLVPLAPARGEERGPKLLSVPEVQGFYAEVFEVSRHRLGTEEAPYYGLSVELKEVDDGHPLALLLRDFPRFIRYLVGNTGISTAARRSAASSPDFQKRFYRLLREDAAFNEAFLEVANRMLRLEGGRIVGYKSTASRDLSAEQLLNVAVRFVYPDGVEANGSIRAHICSGINGLDDLPGPRSLFAEALAYATIAASLYAPESELLKRIDSSLSLAKGLFLSEDLELAVSRAQGVVWGALKDSPELRVALQREQERMGTLFPIRVEWARQ